MIFINKKNSQMNLSISKNKMKINNKKNNKIKIYKIINR